MTKSDHVRVKALLTEAIRMLCKSSLAYKSELNIEGLLGITLDNNDVFLVNINENILTGEQQTQATPNQSQYANRQAKRIIPPTVSSVEKEASIMPIATDISSLPGSRTEDPIENKRMRSESGNDLTDTQNDSDSVIDVKPTVSNDNALSQPGISSLDFDDMLDKYENQPSSTDASLSNQPDSKPDLGFDYSYDTDNAGPVEDDDDIVVVKEELAHQRSNSQHTPYNTQSYPVDPMSASNLLTHEDYLTAVDHDSVVGYDMNTSNVSNKMQTPPPKRGRPPGRGRGRGANNYSPYVVPKASTSDPAKQVNIINNSTFTFFLILMKFFKNFI